MTTKNACPPEIYVRLVYTGNITKENMEVYRQKVADSDEFVCIEHSETPVGQHLIDFLLISNSKLPPLVNEMRKLFTLSPSISKIYSTYICRSGISIRGGRPACRSWSCGAISTAIRFTASTPAPICSIHTTRSTAS